MGYRGRLIQRFKAEIARLDTAAIEAATSYNDNFRTLKKVDSSGDGIGSKDRKEHAVELVPCQVGARDIEQLRQTDMGNDPNSDVTLWFHFRDLENLSLVETSSGKPLINIGDRLVSIKDYLSETTVLEFTTPPGMYVVEATSSGWGISMVRPTRNLLKVVFRPRSAVA